MVIRDRKRGDTFKTRAIEVKFNAFLYIGTESLFLLHYTYMLNVTTPDDHLPPCLARFFLLKN
jgi:hypothetical protein